MKGIIYAAITALVGLVSYEVGKTNGENVKDKATAWAGNVKKVVVEKVEKVKAAFGGKKTEEQPADAPENQ